MEKLEGDMIRSLSTRRIASTAAVVSVLALGGASLAWACSPFQPRAEVRGQGAAAQTSGPVGTKLTFTGSDFAPGSQVQVLWNSRTGQVLAEGQGPSFSVPITIPEALSGVYYIMAVPDVGGSASLAFEVTESRSAPKTNGNPGTSSSVTGGFDEPSTASSANQEPSRADNSLPPSGASSGSGNSSSDPAAAQSGSGSIAPVPNAGELPRVAGNEAASPARGLAPTGSGATPAGSSGRATAASANPAVVTAPGGQAVFGGSSALATSETPSTASASGDTWSGFAATTKPSLLTEGVAGSGSARGSALGMGIGLLGAGIVALLAGFATAESARKRAVAGAGGR